jgi:hypothetical protein
MRPRAAPACSTELCHPSLLHPGLHKGVGTPEVMVIVYLPAFAKNRDTCWRQGGEKCTRVVEAYAVLLQEFLHLMEALSFTLHSSTPLELLILSHDLLVSGIGAQ